MVSPVDVDGGYTYGYQYGVASMPTLLTGIQDRYGEQIDSWTYDGFGRGLTSQQGSGANLTTLVYSPRGSTTVTNPLGVTDTYTFTTLQGVPKVTQIARAATSTTASASRSFTYDSNGYMASKTDWNGNETTYANDSHGDPTTINEAVGSSVARTTTIAYDATWVHLPDSITTPGLTTSFTYDGSGNPLTRTLTDTTSQSVPYSTNGQTRTWTYTYDGTGHPLTAKTPNGNTWTYTWDSSGTLTKVTNPLSQSTSVTAHTAGGYPETVVDPNSVSTALAYDGQMRLTSSAVTTSAGVLTTQYSYWFANLIFTLTLPDSSQWISTPDTAQRIVKFADIYGNNIQYTLDALGDRTANKTYDTTSTLRRQHSATFDALGRILTDVGGAGQTTTYTYDPNGNALTIKDGVGNTTTRTFDALSRISQSTDASSGVAQWTYDAHNRPLSVTDPDSNATSYVYDGFGDVIQQASPDTGTTVYHYDSDGNLTSKTDAAGVVTDNTYDALDRKSTTTYPADSTENVAYTYDQTGSGFSFGIGRLTSLTDAAGSLSLTYDERGNTLSEKRTNGSNVFTTAYTYDKASRIASITYPSGAVSSFTRDLTGNVTQMPFSATHSDESYSLWSLGHLPFGPINAIHYNNGDNAAYSYDLDYRLTTLLYETYEYTPYFEWTYTYDNANNVSSITDSITSANSQAFGYNDLNRLTSASSSGTYGTFEWAYDHNGNLTGETIGGTSYTYATTSGTNRLASFTWPSNTVTYSYTATGNINNITQNSTAVLAATYNKANRLESVTDTPLAITSEIYDAFGRRFSKAEPGSSPIYYTYDQDGNLIEENNNGTVTDYLYVDGVNVANWEPSEQHLYAINTDRLGVPLVSRDEYGLTNWAALTLPYGTMSETVSGGEFTGPVTQNLRFPGQYFDVETSNHYNLNRDYMPLLGRYLEADPIGLAGGLNPYLYANANPGKFTDRWGLQFLDPQDFNGTYELGDPYCNSNPAECENVTWNSPAPAPLPQSVKNAISSIIKFCVPSNTGVAAHQLALASKQADLAGVGFFLTGQIPESFGLATMGLLFNEGSQILQPQPASAAFDSAFDLTNAYYNFIPEPWGPVVKIILSPAVDQ